MDGIIYFFRHLFSTSDWSPRWQHGTWSQFHGWLYIISDLLIWASYFAIPIILYVFIHKRREDLPFVRIFWLFILFLLASGTSHLVDAMIFWYPAFRLNALVLSINAAIAIIAVRGMIKVLPAALSLRTPKQFEKIIKERTEDLEQSNLHLKKLNDDIDNFVYAASHNLKSPINNIEGLLHVLKEELVTPNAEIKGIVDRLDSSILRVKQSIDNITDVIKLQQNPYDVEEKLYFKDIVNEVIDENSQIIRISQGHIDLDLQQPEIFYSKQGLKSIIYNLITNSLKYHVPGKPPEIKIKTHKENASIILEVSDNGLGIDMERNKDKLFILFKRFHNHVEGTGIGLYMIKKLIEEKEGRIEVDSEVNKGTTFKITFRQDHIKEQPAN